MAEETEEGFIGRWSRRKRAVEEAEPHETKPFETVEATESQRAEEDEERQRQMEANRAAAEAVDLEAIDYESDLSVFYKEGVPALLKQAAMRKMWRTSPIFANLDGLNDYDQDFNVIDKVLTEFKSAWQVGRGYAAQVEEAIDSLTGEGVDEAGSQDAVTGDEIVQEPGLKLADDAGDPQEQDLQEQMGDVEPAEGLAAAPLTEASDDAEEPEFKEDARPMVSLRRRMAQFDEE